jgi:hypothetical protein
LWDLCVTDIHVRGFKTERSIMAERIRNPTVSSRLREAFGLSYGGSSPAVQPGISSGSVEKLGSVHQSDVDAEKIKGKTQVLVCVYVWFMLSPS